MPNPVINRRIGGGNPFADDANAIIAAWVANCTAAGETPTDPVIAAVKRFYINCRISGVWSKMKAVNPCAPGTNFWHVTRTPLLAGNGSQPWAVTGGGLNAPQPNGLLMPGGTQVWETGVNLSTLMSGVNNMGITLYSYSSTNGAFWDYGLYDASNNSSYLAGLNSTFSGGSGGAIGVHANFLSTASPGNGYYSLNRVSNTDMRLFFATSTSPHAQIGATAAGSNAGAVFVNSAHFPLGGIFVTSSGIYANQQPATIDSFFALHDGLSESESSALFNAVQAMRVDFNGGFR